MSQLPSIELLESTHNFPGPYSFKVIGTTADYFAERVVAAIRDTLQREHDPEHSSRETAGGKHVSVTVTVVARDAQEVHRVYERLLGLPGLVVLF